MNEALKRILIHHNIAPAKREALADDIFMVLNNQYTGPGQDGQLEAFLIKEGFFADADGVWQA